ncbi:MAG: hypothetical protein R3D01_09680 [Hyphomicrobiales bacterium]
MVRPALALEGATPQAPMRETSRATSKSKRPLALQPQLDMTAEQPDVFATTPPTFDEPDPSPGLRLKIPTN